MPGLGASTGCVRRVVNANLAQKEPLARQHELLFWDAQNRLSEVRDNNGGMLESYWYDAGGGRVKKTSGATATYTFFAHYEEEVTNGVTTAISHYTFGGLRIAVKRGSALYHVHGDHLGSTSLTTAGSVEEGSRTYHPYGSERSASGTLRTDRTFTGQKEDGTGLLYYNARYYDPALGTFISPDSLVPDAGMVIDYNRFLYARGNPLKYSDSSGYASAEWEAMNIWYNARGWFHNPSSRHWDLGANPFIRTRQNAEEVLEDAGIEHVEIWPDDDLILLAQGISAFAKRIEAIPNHRQVNGLAHLDSLINGTVEWRRMTTGTGLCAINNPVACAWHKGAVEFYDALFSGKYDEDYIRGVAVHEFAHVIHFEPFFQSKCGNGGPRCGIAKQEGAFLKDGYVLTPYAQGLIWGVEYWAEAVAVWVFENDYPGLLVDIEKAPYRFDVFDWVEGIVGP